MIIISKNKNPTNKNNKINFKKTLTQSYEEAELFRVTYLNAVANERALENAQSRRMKYHSNYYKQAFINNYEEYYKKGGQQVNQMNNYLYSKITGKDPLIPDKSKRKKTGKNRIKKK